MVNKWPFFYKVIISYLESKENELLEEDMVGILLILNKKNYKINLND